MSTMRRIGRESQWTTWLLFGDSKAGKTSLASLAPRPIILNRDNGTSSLMYDDRYEHVRITDIRTGTDLENAWDNLVGVGKKNWTKRQTVILDDLSSIQQMIMDELMARVTERDPRRQADDPSKKEYGVLGNRLRRWIRKFKDLPMHKIFVCGQQYDEELEQFKPALIGAMRNQIAHYCDGVAYLRCSKKDGTTRRLFLRPKGRVYADTRYWWLPSVIKDPNMSDVLDLVSRGPEESPEE